MGLHCQVCRHPERARIDLMLSRGLSGTAIAKTFSVHKDALWRHRTKHIPDSIKKSLAVSGVPEGMDLATLRDKEGESLIQHLVAQRGRLYALLALAEEAGDINTCVRVHSAITKTLELTGRYVGELAGVNVKIAHNLIVDPAYIELRSGLLQALRDHPDARRAVARVLQKTEGQTPHVDGAVMPIEARKIDAISA